MTEHAQAPARRREELAEQTERPVASLDEEGRLTLARHEAQPIGVEEPMEKI